MGTLTGVKVVEFAGIGPGPFACMMLADMGAEVIRIDRAAAVGQEPRPPSTNTTLRGRRNIALDLKKREAVEAALAILAQADILIEGFRPGVMERLGLGPDIVMKRNPKLIYGRMTGWGQDGPIAKTPGHDINYIALTGALHAIGTKAGGPVPPLNLVGDYGGGALYMVVGVLAAYIERQRSGKGQIVDTSMVEGAASLGRQSGESPGTLANRVASPGGTTRAGLDVLDHDNALKRLVHETLTAAAKRSAELAAAARD